jgi:predicted metal-dependent HD superfamily phosphohydrolase
VVSALAARWPLGAELVDVRDALLAAYATGRGYHDTRHLTEVLDRIDELEGAGPAFDGLPVRLAAWFHDGVYDGEPGAEERSAQWAERALAGREVAGEVGRLVRLTEDHRPADDDPEGCAHSAADLAIPAAPPERYGEYVADVRREYAHVPDDLFGAGRAAVLRGLLAKPTLFHTAHARREWEPVARANVEAELAGLARLTGPTAPTGGPAAPD